MALSRPFFCTLSHLFPLAIFRHSFAALLSLELTESVSPGGGVGCSHSGGVESWWCSLALCSLGLLELLHFPHGTCHTITATGSYSVRFGCPSLPNHLHVNWEFSGNLCLCLTHGISCGNLFSFPWLVSIAVR